MTTVLITGTSRGIGLEFVRQYAQEGARVLATCRKPAAAGALQRIAGSLRGSVSVDALDVTDGDCVAAPARALADVPIDIVINNAGI